MRLCSVHEVTVQSKEAARNKERQQECAGGGRKETELLQQQ